MVAVNKMNVAMVSMMLIGSTVMSSAVYAADGWESSLGTGIAFNQSSDTDINIDNGTDIKQGSFNWEMKPFSSPAYYDLRVTKWLNGQNGAEIELLHHKLYAKSGELNARISKFEVAEKLLFCNYALLYQDSWIARAGVGVTILDSDVVIDGVQSKDSNQFSGVATQLSLEKIIPISEHLIMGLESKVTYSYSNIEFDYGSADLSNTAIHFLVNLKYH